MHLTEVVMSARLVLNSPDLLIAAARISARNSGKLRRQTARIECNPSLSSFSGRPARSHMRSFHLACDNDKLAYAESARKVYLLTFLLMRLLSEVTVDVKRFTSGVRSVENVDLSMAWLDNGANSVNS